jgi:hypothetical protein
MPRRNRVTPLGEIIAHPARGLVFGNRGCLHDDEGRVRRSHAGRLWIACRLSFKDRRRDLMQPGRCTELFFLDEATAFAAGHRPCALCRREDYVHFVEIWRDIHPEQTGADAIDTQLHTERIDRDTRGQRHHEARIDQLPNGAFVLQEGAPYLVMDARLLGWTPSGYVDPVRRPRNARTILITPPSSVDVLRADWRPVVPLLHPSARAG